MSKSRWQNKSSVKIEVTVFLKAAGLCSSAHSSMLKLGHLSEHKFFDTMVGRETNDAL